jgi:Type II secretion system (T2SS), protein G
MKAMVKAKGRRQKAKVEREDERHAVSHPLLLTRGGLPLVIAFALCALAGGAAAQKKPKPALKESEARRVIAATPGFALRTGAVKVRSVSPAGTSPVVVEADVTGAVRLEWVEDERVPQTGGVFKQKRWRAVEFRTGDRAWEEFDLVSTPAFAARLEAARLALEELVTEFAAQQAAAARKEKAADANVVNVPTQAEGDKKDKKKRDAEKKKAEAEKKKAEEAKKVEPLTRGALTVKQLSPMGSSVVAEVVVAATFSLTRDARGRWRVAEVSAGGESAGDLAALWLSADARKAERARADLAALGEALEAFRRERGFYVVARDSVVLLDHLSPRYTERIVRLDPWHNPYRYEGTPTSYTLASDGPDGKQGTDDDVTVSRLPRVIYD